MNIPNMSYEIKGHEFSKETLIIAALMRVIGCNKIELKADLFIEPKGLILGESYNNNCLITLTEYNNEP